MAQHELPLPLEVALRLQITLLQRELAQAQAELLKVSAAQQQTLQMHQILTEAQLLLPVPLTQCTLDLERGVLVYEAPVCSCGAGDACVEHARAPGEIPGVN